MRQEIGFDPTAQAERCTSTSGGRQSSAKDAKTVLERLAPDEARVRACLDADLEPLRERGARTGLTAWLDTAAAEIAPRLGRP